MGTRLHHLGSMKLLGPRNNRQTRWPFSRPSQLGYSGTRTEYLTVPILAPSDHSTGWHASWYVFCTLEREWRSVHQKSSSTPGTKMETDRQRVQTGLLVVQVTVNDQEPRGLGGMRGSKLQISSTSTVISYSGCSARCNGVGQTGTGASRGPRGHRTIVWTDFSVVDLEK
jgi:hypothetical protein